MQYKPTIIIKCLSTQATYINYKYGQMFYYVDKGQVYFDTENKGRVFANNIYVLQYERERNNFIPNNMSTIATETEMLTNDQIFLNYLYIYVVETNALYAYTYATKTWQTIYGKYGQKTVAQTYTPEGYGVTINADDVTTNGILNDGSVVIRDANKMICGLAKSDGYSLYINSLIGGQINLNPSDDGRGCLQLNSGEGFYDTNLNNNLVVFGTIKSTKRENWSKQYRLITQDISISSFTKIKKGSTLKKGSSINDVEYNMDTILSTDVEGTDGLIITGSKVYINSTINNETLKPPYLFDVNNNTEVSIVNKTTVVDDSLVTIDENDDNRLVFFMESPFENVGDCVIFKNRNFNFTEIMFSDDKIYQVDYKATEGTDKSMRIVYYFDNLVKILP